jgi:hypothetical protein
MRSARPPGSASPVSHVHGLAVTVPVPAVMARLRRFSVSAAQPVSADGAPSSWRARGRPAAAARPRIRGGRHRSRASRGDAAAYPPGPGMAGPPAMPGWDADQAVDVLYHAHYRTLTRLAALLVTDVAAAEEIVQAAFAAMHGAWRHLRDSDKALAYLLRKVIIGARSPPCSQPGPGQPPAGPARGRAAGHYRPARPPGSTTGPSGQAARGPGAPVLRGPARYPDRRCAGDQRTRGDMPHRMRPVFPPGWPARNGSGRSPFAGGAPVAADKDARDEHGQEARPVVGRGQTVDRRWSEDAQ